jgi:hypothetical protein
MIAEAQESFMITIETADQKQVRRFRIAQFNGRTATVKLGGSTVTGRVRSIVETASGMAPRWIITIIPTPPKVAVTAALRPTPRTHLFVEDYF